MHFSKETLLVASWVITWHLSFPRAESGTLLSWPFSLSHFLKCTNYFLSHSSTLSTTNTTYLPFGKSGLEKSQIDFHRQATITFQKGQTPGLVLSLQLNSAIWRRINYTMLFGARWVTASCMAVSTEDFSCPCYLAQSESHNASWRKVNCTMLFGAKWVTARSAESRLLLVRPRWRSIYLEISPVSPSHNSVPTIFLQYFGLRAS